MNQHASSDLPSVISKIQVWWSRPSICLHISPPQHTPHFAREDTQKTNSEQANNF